MCASVSLPKYKLMNPCLGVSFGADLYIRKTRGLRHGCQKLPGLRACWGRAETFSSITKTAISLDQNETSTLKCPQQVYGCVCFFPDFVCPKDQGVRKWVSKWSQFRLMLGLECLAALYILSGNTFSFYPNLWIKDDAPFIK
jgi:hypothetical protein